MAATEERALAAHRRTVPHLKTRARLFLRQNIRNSEFGVTVMAAVMGAIVALGVAGTRSLVDLMHHFLFGIGFDEHLSGTVMIEPWRVLAVPCLGGFAYGLIAFLLRRWRPRDIVDAIEANALFGGRMSLSDSLRLTGLTILSAGFGASVGLEAAFTQLGAGTMSRIGRMLHLRRGDLRTFVGCGASAAIAAAFNAPLAGSFYAFELIIGSYTLATMAPVVIAAILATIVTRQIYGQMPIFITAAHVDLAAVHYVILAVLGFVAGLLAIAAMVGVTFVEQWSRKVSLPAWARPGVGGLVLGLFALFYPQILGSGHGGIINTVTSGSLGYELPLLLGLIFAKMVGSAVSIGSGFRGGMFSSSLYLGALYGTAAAMIIHRLVPGALPGESIFILAGMGSVAAGVVGAPITMAMLVLEVTSDFSATLGVTASIVIAALVVRHWFGYSFATWRFHLRGVALHSPHDIGWLHDLQVAKLMRQDFSVVLPTMNVAELCREFPIDTSRHVFVVNEGGGYEGYVDMAEAHRAEQEGTGHEVTAGEIARGANQFLTPGQPVRETLDVFTASSSDTLAVVDNAVDRHIQGYLSEAFALRRYYRELEARHREELGDEDIFSSALGSHEN